MHRQAPDRPARLRLVAAGVATAVAASVTLSFVPAASTTTASRNTSATLVDEPGDTWPGAYDRWRDASPFGSDAVSAAAGLDVADATTAQSSGLLLISSVVEFGAGTAAGTGMVIDGEAGIVVTNHHVIEGSTEIEVTLATTGDTYTAEVLGTDVAHDIAVLQLLDAPALPEVATDTSPLSPDDVITAVGDAGGDGGTLSASRGTVTDIHEPVTVTNDDGTEKTLRNLVEVDADVIAGDSGGALLDADNDVVGMNVAASSSTANITGYAIPIRRVLRITDAVLAEEQSGTIALGYAPFLGVQLRTETGSAIIAGVLEGAAAAEAGLAAGDTVTALGGTPTPTVAALRRAIASHEAGESISLTWMDTTGGTRSAAVELGKAPVA